ncbi:hypothetical protein [Undibacterium sp.]|uniref:hypothetical protein n=1 Tax=Undibacterium sp. TaxID=1914977 RepID=UPI002C851F07|nr:hypothetical protein [Undibacterium sp.]HTD07211.1 hypothetical protein [Undibacterium sp.]
MTSPQKSVSSIHELILAVQEPGVKNIIVQGCLVNVPSLRLAPGQAIEGRDHQATITFIAGQDGLQLSTDNEVCRLRLETSIEHRAIFNDTDVDSLGLIRLTDVVTVGQVQILARDKVRSGHVEVDGLHVAAADARGRSDRPAGFGVHVIQGAFTLWNMQADEQVVITANLIDLSAGSAAAPVLGSGIFVSGPGFDKGRLSVRLLETGPVYSDGRIAPGTPDVITGGVFTVHGAYVDTVRNLAPVVTYGVNDMVLDNWGQVDCWEAEEKITSYGPSGIGFVNFGVVNELKVSAPIETFGQGARGFNVYAGTVNLAEFDRIITHADGAVGVQISQPIGQLRVLRGIETFGATGESLVKGVVTTLSAIGLSIKPGGSAREIVIAGGIATHGAGIAPLEMHGEIGALHITGATRAAS